MKTRGLYGMGIAMLALAATGVAAAPPIGDYGLDLDTLPRRKRGKGQNNRRGKGKRSPPKSRPNMNHISKRVRRKHRRAR
jgi:hypothetical protein